MFLAQYCCLRDISSSQKEGKRGVFDEIGCLKPPFAFLRLVEKVFRKILQLLLYVEELGLYRGRVTGMRILTLEVYDIWTIIIIKWHGGENLSRKLKFRGRTGLVQCRSLE